MGEGQARAFNQLWVLQEHASHILPGAVSRERAHRLSQLVLNEET